MTRREMSLNSKYKYSRNVAVVSTVVLLGGGMTFLRPFSFSENTNAITETTQNGDYYLETTATDLNLTIHTTPAGAQETASHDVTVKTDDPAGYTLTVSVDNDTSNALNLNGNVSAAEKFNATSGTYASPKALDENSWGFADTLAKKDNDQWAAVPLLSNAQQLKQTSSANTSGDTTTVYYGVNAKYDGQHSNGNYSNTIVYSVTGNTIPVQDLSSVKYMHEATYDLCEESADYDPTSDDTIKNTTYTLYDKRTEEPYYIRKLSDDNCWMVENLYLTSAYTLETTYSNMASGTHSLPGSSILGFFRDTTEYMYSGGRNRNDFKQGDYPADGSYFSWVAAKAGTASGKNSDVCPKNWRLPTDDENKTVVNWGTTTFDQAWFADKNGGNNSATPIYPGYYHSELSDNSSTLNGNGSRASWWSSTQGSSVYGRSLGRKSKNSSLSTSGSSGKRAGYSVRCVLSAT